MVTPLEEAVNICINEAMQRLKGLEQNQLEQLLRDNMAITCIAKDLPQICNIQKIPDDDRKLMENIYSWNKTQEEKIAKLQDELTENGEKATKLKQETDALQDKLDNMHQTLDKITHELQAAAISADEDGKILIDALYCGKLNASDFLMLFHEKRRLSHLRKIKSEHLLTISGMERLPPNIYPQLY